MEEMVENVSAITGISQQKLYALKGTDFLIDTLVEEAMAFIEKSSEEKKPRKEAIAQLLTSLRGYLTSGMWVLSRAETLISGVPPSPHVQHLL
jgi:hypothetical protein